MHMNRDTSETRVKAIRRAVTFAVMISLFALAGCGGGGRSNDVAPSEAGREITMASGDNWFDPNELEVSVGETITIVVSNDGVLTHNISIDEFGVRKDYRPGETARVTFTPDRAGEYVFYCDEPGHKEAGMVGVLKVK